MMEIRTEGGFNDANLSSRCVHSSKCTPIIDNETRADDV